MTSAYDSGTGINFNAGQQSDQGTNCVFFLYPERNNFKSEQEGRPVFEDKVYVRITVPGDRKTEVNRAAKDADKWRFPREWAQFEQFGEVAQSGTPLEEWPLMTPAMVMTLKAMNIATVEAMAAVTDGNLNNLGLGARQTRDAARAYLERAKEGAASSKLAAENADLREQIDALTANLADLSSHVRRKEAEAKSE